MFHLCFTASAVQYSHTPVDAPQTPWSRWPPPPSVPPTKSSSWSHMCLPGLKYMHEHYARALASTHQTCLHSTPPHASHPAACAMAVAGPGPRAAPSPSPAQPQRNRQCPGGGAGSACSAPGAERPWLHWGTLRGPACSRGWRPRPSCCTSCDGEGERSDCHKFSCRHGHRLQP